MFKPPSLLAIQVIPTATVFPLGSHGVYIRAEHAFSVGFASRVCQGATSHPGETPT
jgi:hypothetical protein